MKKIILSLLICLLSIGANAGVNFPPFVTGYQSSVVSNVSFSTSGNYGDLTSISLTPGDWLITGTIYSSANGATVTSVVVGISTTSGNSNAGLVIGDNLMTIAVPTAAADSSGDVPGYRISISTTTVYYLKYRASYSVATPVAWGRLSATKIK